MRFRLDIEGSMDTSIEDLSYVVRYGVLASSRRPLRAGIFSHRSRPRCLHAFEFDGIGLVRRELRDVEAAVPVEREVVGVQENFFAVAHGAEPAVVAVFGRRAGEVGDDAQVGVENGNVAAARAIFRPVVGQGERRSSAGRGGGSRR